MKLLVIDGNSLVNRAFYGVRPLTTKDGRFTNGIYGFLNMMLKLRDECSPDCIAVAFDLKAPTFRHKMYSEYKAGRKGMPDELARQLPPLKEIIGLMGIKILETEGYEADDIIGTLASACRKNGDFCYIATGDRDSFQLVGDSVNVMLTATVMGRPEVVVHDLDKIAEKYNGLTPDKLIDVKALMGDSSDNIPGVAGVGEKTAVTLITRFGSLDGVYENIDSPDIKPGVRSKLIKDKNNAYLSRKLGEICCDVPIDTDIAHYTVSQRDDTKLAATLADLEMFKMIERLGLSDAKIEPVEKKDEPKHNFAVVSIDDILQSDEIDLLYYQDDIAAVSGEKIAVAEYSDQLLSRFRGKKLRVYDSKELYHIDPELTVNLDCTLAAYLLNPSARNYELLDLLRAYGIGEVTSFGNESADTAARFSLLCNELSAQIAKSGQTALLNNIELPLARVLSDMESIGVAVDAAGIEQYGDQLEAQINELSAKIYELVGYEFNLNSPMQLGTALFEKLGLPAGKKTKTGYSTGAEVLENLRDKHPAVEYLLEYRQLSKLKSTYCDGLLKVVCDDGRIYSTFNQTETRTGRISSTEPNLQNIPVKTRYGSLFRQYFIAPQGRVLCDADYSQIELRVLAHIADDAAMIDAFNSGVDIHTVTASQAFGVPMDEVTPLMRSKAKAVNFGIVYGIGAFSLAKDIHVSYSEAKQYIDSYMSTYKGVCKYMNEVVAHAKENGYVETMFNRRRPIGEFAASNAALRAFGERVARNAPIQGTAADIIKIAMIRVYDRLKAELPTARLILQVHDELIVEADEADADKASLILREEMENACKLAVPLVADVHVGKTWLEAKG